LGVTLVDGGRVAFLMQKCWGDLRELINVRMCDKHNHGPPFMNFMAYRIMWESDARVRHLSQRIESVQCVRRISGDLVPDMEKNFNAAWAIMNVPLGEAGTGFCEHPRYLRACALRQLNNKHGVWPACVGSS